MDRVRCGFGSEDAEGRYQFSRATGRTSEAHAPATHGCVKILTSGIYGNRGAKSP